MSNLGSCLSIDNLETGTKTLYPVGNHEMSEVSFKPDAFRQAAADIPVA
jgi:hypothetical protein